MTPGVTGQRLQLKQTGVVHGCGALLLLVIMLIG